MRIATVIGALSAATLFTGLAVAKDNDAHIYFAQPPSYGVIIYADADFKHNAWAVTGDTANLAEIHKTGSDDVADQILDGAHPESTPFNDTVSSIKVYGGATAGVYVDKDFRGKCIPIDGDTAQLDPNDEISSIRIRASGEPGCPAPKITLFQHKDMGGSKVEIGESVTNLKDWGFNDEASSIVLSDPTAKVAIYWDSDFKGACRTVTGNDSLLSSNWNDNVSSVKIGETCNAKVKVFKDKNYGGSMTEIGSDVMNLKDRGFNDNITAIQVVGAFPIAVYKDKDLTGACMTVTGNIGNLKDFGGGFNDNITSIRIGFDCAGKGGKE